MIKFILTTSLRPCTCFVTKYSEHRLLGLNIFLKKKNYIFWWNTSKNRWWGHRSAINKINVFLELLRFCREGEKFSLSMGSSQCLNATWHGFEKTHFWSMCLENWASRDRSYFWNSLFTYCFTKAHCRPFRGPSGVGWHQFRLTVKWESEIFFSKKTESLHLVKLQCISRNVCWKVQIKHFEDIE